MSALEVEERTVEPIPVDSRHGRPRDLFGIWFGFNMAPLTLVTGALGVALGLPAIWTVTALIVGNMLGGLTMAFHAAQGPTLGVPQMLQARGQFGLHGATILAAIQAFVCVGYMISALITSGQSLGQLFPSINTGLGITAIGVISFGITFFGFRMIAATAQFTAYITAVIAIALLVFLVATGRVDGATVTSGEFSAATFFLVLGAAASWQVAYGPVVSDYSRYLPPVTGPRSAFWFTYLGSVVGCSLMMCLGALAASTVTSGDALAGIGAIGALGTAILALFVVSGTVVNTVNIYSGQCARSRFSTRSDRAGTSVWSGGRSSSACCRSCVWSWRWRRRRTSPPTS
ncbi:cytosine permease [Gordonia sp. Z-3]|uniref:purine-cytosine permease family protein n=1 Tax=Gordonia sp. Z-3 TaxID=3115408 RepID=UPI002E289FEA|nr:cytosine permease [Gordonia sp. Z-3]MED5803839.1 cytosine permease [Gordonia sp. Z-3]